MDRIIYGCSNVYRFYDGGKELKANFIVMRTTNLEKLQEALADFNGNGNPIIIAMVENAISEKIKNVTSTDEAEEQGKDAIDNFFEILGEAKKTMKQSIIFLVKPLTRPAVQWYNENLATWSAYYEGRARAMRKQKVVCMSTIRQEEQEFVEDRIHLTKDSGIRYVKDIIKGVERYIEDNEEMEMDHNNKSTEVSQQSPSVKSPGIRRQEGEKDVDDIMKRLQRLEQKVNKHSSNFIQLEHKRFNDNLVLSKIREELDTATNHKKLDKVFISGILPTTRYPGTMRERGNWIKTQATIAIGNINKQLADKIKFANGIGKMDTNTVAMEITMNSIQAANEIKKQCYEKGTKGSQLWASDCVTPATRVRKEILKAIAKNATLMKRECLLICKN